MTCARHPAHCPCRLGGNYMKFPILACFAVLLSSTVASASDVGVGAPSARSPVASESGSRTSSEELDARVVAPGLTIDLGPLPAEAGNSRLLQRTHKRLRIGVHRELPTEFTGDLVPLLAWDAGGNGRHTAAVTFTAQGAVSLRIAVHAELPAGAAVRMFDGDGQARARFSRRRTSLPIPSGCRASTATS